MSKILKYFICCLILFISVSTAFAIIETPQTQNNINIEAAQKALVKYNQILSTNPNNEDALINRAYICYILGNVQSAIEDYNKLILLNPQNEDFYLNRGFLYHISDNRDLALKDYQTALKLKPNYDFVYNNLGVVLSEMGKPQESLAAYNKALEINPNYADAYYNRGNLKTRTNKDTEALEDFNKAIALNPTDSASFNNRGVVKRKLNYNIGALSDFSIAIRLDPNDITAFANRGRLKKRYFDSEGAEEDFKVAINIAEENPQLVKELQLEEKIASNYTPQVKMATPESAMLNIAPAQMNKELRMPKVTPAKTKEIITKYTAVAENTTPATNVVKAGIVKLNPTGATVSTKTLEPKEPTITTKPVQNPKLAECYFIRALQKYIIQDRQNALNDFNMAIKYNPNYAEAYYYRAAIKKDNNDSSFIEDYKKAVSLDSSLKRIDDANVLTILK